MPGNRVPGHPVDVSDRTPSVEVIAAITDDDPGRTSTHRPHVVRSLEGRILAGSRPTSTTPTGTDAPRSTAPNPGPRTGEADQQKIPGAPLRVSFAKISEPLGVPDLLALQTASFDWLVGSVRCV